jgi:late competence protein required for DNA uptake (superfamily II DNA/RNA helicase)
LRPNKQNEISYMSLQRGIVSDAISNEQLLRQLNLTHLCRGILDIHDAFVWPQRVSATGQRNRLDCNRCAQLGLRNVGHAHAGLAISQMCVHILLLARNDCHFASYSVRRGANAGRVNFVE